MKETSDNNGEVAAIAHAEDPGSQVSERKPLGTTSGNRFGFKPAQSQLAKPSSLLKPKVDTSSLALKDVSAIKDENEQPAALTVAIPPAAVPGGTLSKEGPAQVERKNSARRPSPRVAGVTQPSPRTRQQFSLGLAPPPSRLSRVRRPSPIVVPSSVNNENAVPGRPPLSRETPPSTDGASSAGRKRKPTGSTLAARKVNSRVSPTNEAREGVKTVADNNPEEGPATDSGSSEATNASDEENFVDKVVSKIYGDDYVEKTREVLNMGLNNKSSTRSGSRYGQRNRVDEQQASWLRALRTTLRDSLDKQKELVDQIKQHEIQMKSRYQVLSTTSAAVTKTNEDLKTQLARAETRIYQMTNDAMSSFSKKDELLEEHRALLGRQQEALDAKSKAESEKAEVALKLAEMTVKCDVLSQQLEQKTKEIEGLLNDMKKVKETQSSVVHEEIEVWKRKLVKAEERHQAEILEISKQCDNTANKKSEVELELQQLQKRVNEMEFKEREWERDNRKISEAVAAKEREIGELKQSLQKKDSEVAQALSSFAQVQAFAQDANNKLVAEKKQLEEEMSTLKSDSHKWKTEEAVIKAECNHLRSEIEELKKKIETLGKDKDEAMKATEESKQRAQDLDRSATVEKELRALLESQMRELRTEYVALTAQMQAVKSEAASNTKKLEGDIEQEKEAAKRLVEKAIAEKEQLKVVIEKLEESKVELESELRTVRESVHQAKDTELAKLCEVTKEADVLRLRLKELGEMKQTTVAEKEKKIAELELKVAEGETQRRKMHNLIQELRGNVRVFVRARPILPSDNIAGDSALSISCHADGQGLRLVQPLEPKIDPVLFSFDKVFPPSSGQDSIFEEVSEFVQSALDGYNVCLFSYGQTGSGKTHTMQGSGNGQMRGIIPRSIEKVMSQSDSLASQGWKYSMQVSFLEIYNETIKDLLGAKNEEGKKLDIKRDASGKMFVNELTLISVEQPEQVESLMEQAAKQRSVGFTEMNAQSSRSHSVFTLYIRGENESLGAVVEGRLNLCDLAGSERLSRSQATGDRLKETQAINKSLSCLTDVFVALANKNAHVPFRNSKLTYLLQDCLSGDGKTLMMVNLSPTPESYHESLCSLRFARQVNQCELGKPKRQIKSRTPSITGSENDEDGSPTSSGSSQTSGGGGGSSRPPVSKSSTSRRTASSSQDRKMSTVRW